jgi:hypothetical protein
MKKLLDESTDDLTRSLLQAGIEHRPPAGAKAQLILALGAGGAVGLFSSNAFAWLGTTAGKLTVLSMTLAVAGAVYVGVSGTGEERLAHDASSAPEASAPEASAPEASVPPAAHLAEGPPAGSPAPQVGVAASQADARRLGVNRGKNSGKTSERRKAGTWPAAPSEPAGELSQQVAERARLDAEVELVDDMHGAARHEDHATLKRLLEIYRTRFPDGQLRQEVAEFAVRVQRH